MRPTKAIVRGIPSSYNRVTYLAHRADIALARIQHKQYCDTLRSLGVEVIELMATDSYPDRCFVQDCAVVVDDKAIICKLAKPTRQGEERDVYRALREHVSAFGHIFHPGTLEGGDIVQTEDTLFVGISGRTNHAGIDDLGEELGDTRNIVPIHIESLLHLGCVMSYLGDNKMLLAEGWNIDAHIRDSCEIISIPHEESYAGNVIAIGNSVIIPAGYPETKRTLESHGFKTIPLDMSEIAKADGSLTCLSVLF